MKKNTAKQSEHRIKIANFLEKIVIDVGVGRLSNTPKFEEKALVQIISDISAVSSQRPQIRKAKKSIAGFKIREGQIVGLRVTLRRKRMVDFFERLIKIVLPRVRDFNGLKLESVDNGGVLNTGLREQFVFPEIDPEKSQLSFSLGISMVPRIRAREESIEQFRAMGAPLQHKPKQ